MLSVFVDTSIFFAAVYSASGSARDLMILAGKERVKLVVSQSILEETERNIIKKLPHRLDFYQQLIFAADLEVIDPINLDVVADVATYVVAKDVHVIAAAITAKPDYVVTYDHKHLLDVPEVAARSGLKIVTPDIVVAQLRSAE